MEKLEFKIKKINKNGSEYYIAEDLKKWIFFKYPEVKAQVKEGVIIVNCDFITIKDNTLFYNSKFINYKKATV